MFQKIRKVAANLLPAPRKPEPKPKPVNVGHTSQSAYRAPVKPPQVQLTASAGTPTPSRSNLPAITGADVNRLTAQRSTNPNLAAILERDPAAGRAQAQRTDETRRAEPALDRLRTTVTPQPTDDAQDVSGQGDARARSADLLQEQLKTDLTADSTEALAEGLTDGAEVLAQADAGDASDLRDALIGGKLGLLGAKLGEQVRALTEQAPPVEDLGLSTEQQEAYDALPPSEQTQFRETRTELGEDAEAIDAQNALLEQGRTASAEEARAYSRLSESQKKDFETISAQVEGNREAQDALFELLGNGSLTKPSAVGPGTDGPESTLLGELARIDGESANLSPEQLQQVVGEVLVDVASPDGITQDGDYACAPTNVRAFLAMDNPAEYARLVADLALTGETQLKMTDPATGEPRALRLGENREFSADRSLAEQLVGDTLLDAANGAFRTVGENGESENLLAKVPFIGNLTGSATTNGATAEWTAQMMEMVTGEPHGYLGIDPEASPLILAFQKGALMGLVDKLHGQGEEPMVKLVNDGVGHMVRVTDVTDDEVTFYDPATGEETTLPRSEFTGQAELVVANDEALPSEDEIPFLAEQEGGTVSGQGHDRQRSSDLEPFKNMLKG